MKKIVNLNLLLVFLVFFSVIFMSIGYSALNRNLTISGEVIVGIPSDIRITNIEMKSVENEAYFTYSPIFTNTTSQTSVTLLNANSTITIVIEVTNNTSDYYHLDNIIEQNIHNANIGYEIANKEIIYFSPNSVTEIEITFFYETYDDINQNKNLNLNYEFKKIIYKNLDYVIYSGNEYIDTGLSNTGDYIFEMDFYQTELTAGDGGWLISGRTAAAYTLGVFNGKSGVFNGYGGLTSAKRPYITLNTWYSLYFSRFKHTIGEYNYSVNGGNIIPAEYETTIRIGGATEAYAGGYDPRNWIGYIKEVKITNAEDMEILKYYVPAEIIEGPNIGEVGYWDVINDVFCGNDGTGEFLAP